MPRLLPQARWVCLLGALFDRRLRGCRLSPPALTGITHGIRGHSALSVTGPSPARARTGLILLLGGPTSRLPAGCVSRLVPPTSSVGSGGIDLQSRSARSSLSLRRVATCTRASIVPSPFARPLAV